MNINELEQLSADIRKQMITMADYCGGDAHWGGALSCADMLAVLFGAYLNISDKNLSYGKKDKFILSKGQSAIALYSTLAECGIVDREYLQKFQQNGSMLAELAIMDEAHGIECSGGSLGMGLPMGIGMALAARKKGYTYKTVVMLGDGECNEGSVWEAIMLGGQLKLNHITMIIDLNGMQSDGITEAIIDNRYLKDRIASFGWNTSEIDGHSIEQCLAALREEKEGPKAIVMKTVKGKGISFMENDNAWHHKVLSKEWLEQARKEVGL